MTARALLEAVADEMLGMRDRKYLSISIYTVCIWADRLRAIASSLEGQAVRCDAIPKHDWQELSCDPGLYEPSMESGYKRCTRCGTRVNFSRERTVQSKDKPA